MNTYPEDKDIEIEVQVIDASGEPFMDSCDAKWTLTDVDDEILSKGEVKGVTEGVCKIKIESKFNTAESGRIKDMRVLYVEFSTENTELQEQTIKYLVAAKTPLVVGANSFVTLEQAQLLAETTPNMTYFKSASEEQIVQSLSASYEKIASYRFRLNTRAVMENVAFVSEVAWRPRAITDDDPMGLHSYRFKLSEVTPESYKTLPEDFRKALSKAQVLEANSQMAPTDSIEQRRRKGVILETINEVKMMFSSTTPVKENICSEAMSILAPWIDRSMRIGRA